MFRKVVFWTHLSAGVVAGLVVLVMSVTGVILTFERQILSWSDEGNHVEVLGSRKSIDDLIRGAPDPSAITSVKVMNNPAAPVELRAGRRNQVLLNPYTAKIVEPENESLHAFFDAVTGWHRWFNLTGDSRTAGRSITDASNLIFLFILVSGAYLWLPPMFKWSMFRARLWFRGAKTVPARDFNWHHVFGAWSLIPLIVVVATATVFGYSWANNLVYQVVGEKPPVRGARPTPAVEDIEPSIPFSFSLDALTKNAIEYIETAESTTLGSTWQSLTLDVPDPSHKQASFSVDMGNGGQPQLRHAFSMDRQTGNVLEFKPFASQSPGRKLRSWVRFLHTGEALGPVGQAVAGAASFAAIFMVWTGLSLALRRLRRFRNKQRRIRYLAEIQTTPMTEEATS